MENSALHASSLSGLFCAFPVDVLARLICGSYWKPRASRRHSYCSYGVRRNLAVRYRVAVRGNRQDPLVPLGQSTGGAADTVHPRDALRRCRSLPPSRNVRTRGGFSCREELPEIPVAPRIRSVLLLVHLEALVVIVLSTNPTCPVDSSSSTYAFGREWLQASRAGHFRKPRRRSSVFCSSSERRDGTTVNFFGSAGFAGFAGIPSFFLSASENLSASARSSCVIGGYSSSGGPRYSAPRYIFAPARMWPGQGNRSIVFEASAQPNSKTSGLRSFNASA